MTDEHIHKILNSLDGIEKASPPEDFQYKVLHRWYTHQETDHVLMRYRYWAVASLLGFTLLNAMAMYSLKQNNDPGMNTASINTETQFTEEYKLVKTSDYYTFNETTK